MKKGKLIVISGPSGCGKGTVIAQLLKRDEKLRLSVSMTTRAPRPGEENAREYYFVSRDEFIRRITDGEFFEYTEYNGNLYGTPKKEVIAFQEQGYSILLDIEVEGAENFRKAKPDNLLTIFLAPPSFEVLKNRLVGRGTESMEVIEKRLARAEKEMLEKDKYDYVVINDRLEDTIETILRIIND